MLHWSYIDTYIYRTSFFFVMNKLRFLATSAILHYTVNLDLLCLFSFGTCKIISWSEGVVHNNVVQSVSSFVKKQLLISNCIPHIVCHKVRNFNLLNWATIVRTAHAKSFGGSIA